MARPDRITKLATSIKQREKDSDHIFSQLNRFRELLYQAIAEVLSSLVYKGVQQVDAPRREQRGEQELLYFSWIGHQFVCVPCDGLALPPPEEAELLGERANSPAARLAMFGYSPGEPEQSILVSDHYIFADGSWCACGLEPTTHSGMRAKEIARYSLRLLGKLDRKLDLVWSPRHEIRSDGADGSCPRLIKHPILHDG
jgi:hypothetical protein